MKRNVVLSRDSGGSLKKLSWVVCLVLSVLIFGSQEVPAIELFTGKIGSGGIAMLTPETISPVPTGAYGGIYDNSYFVPDPGRTTGAPAGSNIWIVPKGPGLFSQFSPTTMAMNGSTVGGLFLPSGWGAGGQDGNKFMTVGWQNFGTPPANYSSGYFNVYNADGTYTTRLTLAGRAYDPGPPEVLGLSYLPKTPVLAPAGWGSFGGQLLIADGAPAVYAIDSDWNKSNLINVNVYPELARFGLAFAPAGWGAAGGHLMTSSDFRLYDPSDGHLISITGRITAVDSSGNETKWAEFSIPTYGNYLARLAADGLHPGRLHAGVP